MPDIFKRERLSPTQLRTVAQRRFEDASYLCDSGDNARANGVFYLGGFVIECLLKALLLEKFPSMRKGVSPEKLSTQDRKIWSLVYRSHDLKEMLRHLPDVQRNLLRADGSEKTHRFGSLKSICDEWTIFARYSPHMEKMKDAREFLNEIRDLKEWLR